MLFQDEGKTDGEARGGKGAAKRRRRVPSLHDGQKKREKDRNRDSRRHFSSLMFILD